LIKVSTSVFNQGIGEIGPRGDKKPLARGLYHLGEIYQYYKTITIGAIDGTYKLHLRMKNQQKPKLCGQTN